MTKYAIIGGTPCLVNVKRLKNGNYQSSDFTYPAAKIYDWDQLSDELKRKAIMAVYEDKLESLDWAIAKDNSLAPLKSQWKSNLITERDRHLAEMTPWETEV